MRGSSFGDVVIGSTANEEIRMLGGNDTIDGGGGRDTLRYTSGSGQRIIDLGADNQTVAATISDGFGGLDTVIRMEDIRTGSGNDILAGDNNTNAIRGGGGNDVIDGRGGNDSLCGEAGADTISGGDGFDFLQGDAGNDALDGGNDSDQLRGGLGSDVIDSGNGNDTADFSDLVSGVIANLSSTTQFGVAAGQAVDGTGGTDTLISIENLMGTNFADTLIGSDGFNFIHGSVGNDYIDGGAGSDYISYAQSFDGVTVDLAQQGSAQFVSGSQGFDTLLNIENVHGSSVGDVISGDASDNILQGEGGNDFVAGGAGNDTYAFGRNDGQDTLDNLGSDAISTDSLLFEPGIAVEQLWFTQQGDDLNVRIVGSDDQVTVAGWYTDTAKRIDQFQVFGGETLAEANVQQLVDAMAAFAPPTGVDPNLPPEVMDDLQPTLAAVWS